MSEKSYNIGEDYKLSTIYRRLEYIKFNGSEYINTNITNHLDKYRIYAISVNSTINSPSYIFGCCDTYNTKNYFAMINNYNGLRYSLGSY